MKSRGKGDANRRDDPLTRLRNKNTEASQHGLLGLIIPLTNPIKGLFKGL